MIGTLKMISNNITPYGLVSFIALIERRSCGDAA